MHVGIKVNKFEKVFSVWARIRLFMGTNSFSCSANDKIGTLSLISFWIKVSVDPGQRFRKVF